MYDTHNPGFCYHHTGAIKDEKLPKSMIEEEKISYETVRDMIFTQDELDFDKIVCLHLLTTHVDDGFEDCELTEKSNLIGTQEGTRSISIRVFTISYKNNYLI